MVHHFLTFTFLLKFLFFFIIFALVLDFSQPILEYGALLSTTVMEAKMSILK